MDISAKEALDFVIQAYVAAAAEREDLELLHLLSTSPDSRPPSSDEFSDDDLETFGKPVGRVSAADPAPATPDDAAKKTPQKDSKIVFSADQPSDAFVFAREEVPQLDPEAEPPTSALSAMLSSGGGSSGSGGKEVQLRIFGDPIPGDPLDILVPERATIAQVITVALNEYMRLNNMEMLFLESVDFELLMAEDDGFLDDEMPKLVRTQIIGDVAWEFFSLRKYDKPQDLSARGTGAEQKAPMMLRIFLPSETHGQKGQNRSILIRAEPETLLSELMQIVCKKPTVQLDPAKHVFKRDADDEKELNISSPCEAAEHDLTTNESGQRQLWLAARVYEDAPRQQGLRPGSRSVDQEPETNVASETDIIFSDVTAARYKEYNVVKINKRGVKQERVLGIDRERFYNIARSGSSDETAEKAGGGSTLRDWGLKTVGLRSATGGTKHPFHHIRDIDSVSRPRDQDGKETCSFCCVFKDPLEESRRKEYQYEAASNYEAAEIVAKINHLIQLHTKGREGFRSQQSTPRKETVRRGYRRGSNLEGSGYGLRNPSTII